MYYDKMTEKLHPQYLNSGSLDKIERFDNFNDFFGTPKSNFINNTFDHFNVPDKTRDLIHPKQIRKFSVTQVRASKSSKSRARNKVTHSLDELNNILNVNKLIANPDKVKVSVLGITFTKTEELLEKFDQSESSISDDQKVVIISRALNIVDHNQVRYESSNKKQHNQDTPAYMDEDDLRIKKTERYNSTFKGSSYESSADMNNHQIESRLSNNPPETNLQTHQISVHTQKSKDHNPSGRSVMQQARQNFVNLKTCFHRKRISATPECKMAMSTFDEKDQEDVNLAQSDMRMVIRTYDKNFPDNAIISEKETKSIQTPLNPEPSMKSTSTQGQEAIRSKWIRNDRFIEYESILIENRNKKRRARTAHRQKNRGKLLCSSGSFVTPIHEVLSSPIQQSLYLSRKNSYERMFGKPEPKNDIHIVGKNIKKYVEQLEKHINKDMITGKIYSINDRLRYTNINDRDMQKVPQNKINLVLDSNNKVNNNQSNDTYSAVISESTRKTPYETYRSKNLISRTKGGRQNSSPFAKPPTEYEQEKVTHNINSDASKLLISNIKSI